MTDANRKFKSVILQGIPKVDFVRYTNDHAIDLLVISSLGLNRLQQFVLGRVSHKVIKEI